MTMRKLILCLGLSTLMTNVSIGSTAVKASVVSKSQISPSSNIAIAADQSAVAKQTNALLIANGALARKIAAHIGVEIIAKEPPSGDVLQQNLFLILQNQDTFRAIAAKVGASAAPAGAVEGADQSARNHSILLTNKKIVGAILKKLGITPTPPTLTGTFEEKNVTLLMGNRKALDKIAAKLGVK
jgi:hypothetical protein